MLVYEFMVDEVIGCFSVHGISVDSLNFKPPTLNLKPVS